MKYRKIMSLVLATSIVAQANAINFQDVKDKVKDLYENHKTGFIAGSIVGATSVLAGASALAYKFLKKKPKPKPKGLFRIGNCLKIAGLAGIATLLYKKRNHIWNFGKDTWNKGKGLWRRFFGNQEAALRQAQDDREKEARERAEREIRQALEERAGVDERAIALYKYRNPEDSRPLVLLPEDDLARIYMELTMDDAAGIRRPIPGTYSFVRDGMRYNYRLAFLQAPKHPLAIGWRSEEGAADDDAPEVRRPR